MRKNWVLSLLLILTAPSVILAVNTAPAGAIESITGSTVRGWACDPDEPAASIAVHFYADSTYEGGDMMGEIVADLPSSGLTIAACNGGSAHNFEFVFRRYEKSRVGPGNHPIYAYGIDTEGGVNPLLQNSPMMLAVTGIKTPLHAITNLNSDCRYYNNGQWNRILRLGNCTDAAPAWNIRGTNETATFSPAGFFLPDDSALDDTDYAAARRPYWSYAFHPRSDGTYQLGWVVDKVNFPTDLNRYSAAFLNDVAIDSAADLGGNVFIDVNAALFANEQILDSSVGLSKNRTSVGVVTRWAGNSQVFLEVNLFKTPNFDLCTPTWNGGGSKPVNCDPSAIYDRRADYDTGELVYYDIDTLYKVAGYPQSALAAGGAMTAFTIPVAQLFKKHPWSRPPATWSGIKVEGVYLGHEVWGKGRVWAEFADYQIYSFAAD